MYRSPMCWSPFSLRTATLGKLVGTRDRRDGKAPHAGHAGGVRERFGRPRTEPRSAVGSQEGRDRLGGGDRYGGGDAVSLGDEPRQRAHEQGEGGGSGQRGH